MKKLLEGIGALLLIQGVAALVHRFVDWAWLDDWGVVQRLGFLDGYELYAGIALVVLAFALFAASENVKS
ncbi:hypothetical protein [Streptomyces sp. NPDC059009]|uniref:hypothetical protein n=1 Tax=Streptomyces sp. NPDC059009 TaxID=3346694 RepID=UPI0036A91468